MNGYNEFLSSDEVIYIVSNLTVDDQAFLVGGQAASLWAEYYVQFEPELSQYEPFTTKDVDYFGGVKAAEKLAAAINGKVVLPSKDTMNSNSTALVEASVNDRTVVIDFLHDIIGVNRKEFEKGVATILLKTEKGQTIEIPLMHPVLCLKSRLGNMLSAATMRRDEVATRQAHAAVLVVKAYIEEALRDNDVKEAMRCLFDVLHYVNSDMYGRNAHVDPGIDALTIVKAFADDDRLNPIWREKNLHPFIGKVETKRAERSQRLSDRSGGSKYRARHHHNDGENNDGGDGSGGGASSGP